MNRFKLNAVFLLAVFCTACGGSSSGPVSGGSNNSSSTSSTSSTTSASNSSTSSSSTTSSSTSTSSASSSSSTSSGSASPTLPQLGNPVYAELENYESWLKKTGDDAAKLSGDKIIADNIISWQMPHGGFFKFKDFRYSAAWNGSDPRADWTADGGVELGTIDNNATVSEVLFLADVYKRSGETKYRDAAQAALEFLLTMQTASGGWPQVYPARSGSSYSNYVTFNDNAMARVLILLDKADRMESPLGGDVFTDEQRSRIALAIGKGVDFILKAQILQNDVKTVWCAQHDPVTYAPRPARSYELASKSGKESVLVVAFLMTRPQSEEITTAVKSALAWYRNPNTQEQDTAYIKRTNSDDTYNPIQPKTGSTMWYRFYDLDKDVAFFSGRSVAEGGEGKQYDIMLIEPERRYGYEWGGSYGVKILNYAATVGY